MVMYIFPCTADAFASVEVCTAKRMDVWWAMSLLPKIIAILFGLFFAYKVRKLNHNFNEAKYISLAVYNVRSRLLGLGLLINVLFFHKLPSTIGGYVAGQKWLACVFVFVCRARVSDVRLHIS